MVGSAGALPGALFADTETTNQLGVTGHILGLHVVQEAPALADQLQQPATRVMILRVRLEVLGEIADAFAENSDLNFWRAGIGVVGAVRGDELGLTIFIECHRGYLRVRPSGATLPSPPQSVNTKQ